MKWIDNLVLYCDSKRTGSCPVCGSDRIEVTEHTHGHRRSLSFYCRDCKSADHFDGVSTGKAI